MALNNNEDVDMLLDAGDEMKAHWEQWMGGAAFKLGDETTLEQFSNEMALLDAAGLAKEKAADALEMADAHEQELAGNFKKKVLGYPTAVENKTSKESVELENCPYLAHQRKRRRRTTTSTTGGGTTQGLPTDVH